jgi:hypothetical protein
VQYITIYQLDAYKIETVQRFADEVMSQFN